MVEIINKPRVICENNDSIHRYFGWPSVGRLPDGSLAMVSSGFRLSHVCPFGKGTICYSRDEGKSWTKPAVILDTPLDDRDCGIVSGMPGTAAENVVIVTSFNNKVEFQRRVKHPAALQAYVNAYLDYVDSTDAEEKYLGSTFVISRDGGCTFGEFGRIPITSPHGPAPTADGRFLYVGRRFTNDDSVKDGDCVECYMLNLDGSYEKRGRIDNITEFEGLLSCEPHAIILPSGRIIVHIRVQSYKNEPVFTVYQSESDDGGYTFTTPHRLLGRLGGSPAHIFRHSSGALVSVYGYREAPYGIRAMISHDDGESWQTDIPLVTDEPNGDLGYPASVELADGSILTVYYCNDGHGRSVIKQFIWKI